MIKGHHPDLIASCGMNCRICIGFFSYTISGGKRKKRCIGCEPSDKNCAFIKKRCKRLIKKEINYCYECKDFPCNQLEKLDKRYRVRFDMSMIDNLQNIRDNGIEIFLKQQEKKYRCQKCGEIICVHTNKCYNCEPI